jgi:multiple sugar transport system substrate-binding protein
MDAGLALGTQRGIPANSDIRAKVGENLDEIMKQSYAAVDATIANTGDVIPEMYPANGMEFISELTNQYELLIYGMTTPAEAPQG